MDAKVASIMDQFNKLPPEVQAQWKKLGELWPNIVGLAAMGGAAVIYKGIKNKINQSNVKSNITDMAKSFESDPAFNNKEDVEKAKARLYEIARQAPHVTLNADLTKSLIKKRLHTGLSIEDKQLLTILQAQLNQDSDVSKFMPQMPMAKVGSILADAVLIKEAALPAGAKNTAKYLAVLSAIPVLSSITTGAINTGMAKLKQRELKKGLEDSFSKALGASDPDREPLLHNKEKARQAFATLSHFAPHVALDPHAARAFMNKIVSYDQGVDAGTVKELSEITKNLSSSQSVSPFVSGFAVGANMVGMPKIVGGGIEGISKHLAEESIQPQSSEDINSIHSWHS